jgi:hypothetical protein
MALRSSTAGVAFRTDGCLPSDGRARSESVSASCAMVGWALSIGLIDLPFSHWTYVPFKHGVQVDSDQRIVAAVRVVSETLRSSAISESNPSIYQNR